VKRLSSAAVGDPALLLPWETRRFPFLFQIRSHGCGEILRRDAGRSEPFSSAGLGGPAPATNGGLIFLDLRDRKVASIQITVDPDAPANLANETVLQVVGRGAASPEKSLNERLAKPAAVE